MTHNTGTVWQYYCSTGQKGRVDTILDFKNSETSSTAPCHRILATCHVTMHQAAISPALGPTEIKTEASRRNSPRSKAKARRQMVTHRHSFEVITLPAFVHPRWWAKVNIQYIQYIQYIRYLYGVVGENDEAVHKRVQRKSTHAAAAPNISNDSQVPYALLRQEHFRSPQYIPCSLFHLPAPGLRKLIYRRTR